MRHLCVMRFITSEYVAARFVCSMYVYVQVHTMGTVCQVCVDDVVQRHTFIALFKSPLANCLACILIPRS